METFFDSWDADAHDKFVKWRDHNQRGYVVNRRSPSNAMIHRASCGHFVFAPDEPVSLTRTMKICSLDKRELEGWARENTIAGLRRCRSCM